MNEQRPDPVQAWWRTAIVDIAPGSIRIRGYAIEDLIGNLDFSSMVWLMLRGEVPTMAQARLLEAALVAAVDHGPQAPSIAIARMTATCGVALNSAVAAGVNALGDVHGGAGQQCMELYRAVAGRWDEGMPLERAVEAVLDGFGPDAYVPGFGHRFHPVDPRAVRLLQLVGQAADAGTVSGRFARIAQAVEALLERRVGRRIPMNIDGATAVVFCELDFPPALGRGLFILSRAVGILAHAWEQMLQGERIKGPTPPRAGYTYEGVPPRPLPPRT
ncbi:MAG: citryl-CoA lyase [Armatimonadota bacterium]|nr:citryl-CoA lyase [Armatimonadota bacterium]MDR7451055.1 citryl-CoA lyase [Armatimonadota bacterium]MDR7465924.1 citryl-CoA lyase [Armatimonadota bacterium]MDR7493989.1 citryl-CoA lyase [Armatimonadota bacterium]MDR7498439.1 citryl-CoA lyase [Armatimonadota bacterium]